MTRRFLIPAAILFMAQLSLHADDDLVKSAVLENNVAYLRVGEVEKNLPKEIQSAENSLVATNKIAGTVLDLRFADGSDLDSEKWAKNLLDSKKLPLTILVNDETRGAAIELAKDLRAAKAGLIFGDSKELQPDISVSTSAEDEKNFLENPFVTLAQSETNSVATTNNFLSFVDHTTEADLVREKIKDGEQDENSAQPPNSEPQKPFIRDPVLARAVDLIKGLAIVRQSRL